MYSGDNDNFQIYVVVVSSVEEYAKRLSSRVMQEPEAYGRLGWIRIADVDGKAKEDLLENGPDGAIWKPFITRIAQSRYKKQWRSHKEIADHFPDVKIYKN